MDLPDEQFILDASAMLAYLNNEDGVEIIDEVLERGGRNEAKIFITAMDLAEIFHIVLKKEGRDKALKTILLIKNLPVESVGLDESLLMLAGEIRVQFPLSLGDALVAALAKTRKAKIITGDSDFKGLEKEIECVWIKGGSHKWSNKLLTEIAG